MGGWMGERQWVDGPLFCWKQMFCWGCACLVAVAKRGSGPLSQAGALQGGVLFNARAACGMFAKEKGEVLSATGQCNRLLGRCSAVPSSTREQPA